MKKLSLISLLILLCNCASNYKYFNLKENTAIPKDYKIYVRNVDVNLKEEKISSDLASQKYQNQEKLKEIFKEKMIFSLKEENLYSAQKNDPNVFEADFNINYV